MPVINPHVATRSGGHPCGSFRNPAPCSKGQCSLEPQRGTQEEVIHRLEDLGFKRDDSATDLELGSARFTRPETQPGCRRAQTGGVRTR